MAALLRLGFPVPSARADMLQVALMESTHGMVQMSTQLILCHWSCFLLALHHVAMHDCLYRPRQIVTLPE